MEGTTVEVVTVKAMAEPEMTARMKGYLMPEPAMAEAKREAGTKFHFYHRKMLKECWM